MKALLIVVLLGLLTAGCFGGSSMSNEEMQEILLAPKQVCMDGLKFYCIQIPDKKDVCLPTTHVLTADGKPIPCRQ